MKEQSLTGLIEAIYTTVLAPQAWSGVLEGIHQEIGLDGWSLLHVRDQVKVCAVGGERANAAAAQRYESYYGAIDPRAAHVRGTPVGMVCADQNLFDERFVDRNEFYQDFLLPDGLRYAMGAMLRSSEAGDYVLGLHRGPERGLFQEREQVFLRYLIPHMNRALMLADRMRSLEFKGQACSDAVGTTPMAVLSLDLQGRLVWANPRGEKMLRDATMLALKLGQLTAVDGASQTMLQDAVDKAKASRQASYVLLTEPVSVMRFSVAVCPTSLPDAGLLCLVSPLDQRRLASVRHLMTLFRLTPAEARLARALACGETLEEYVETSGAKMSTIRTQLRAAFVKTRTDRQSELVRLLQNLPAIRDT